MRCALCLGLVVSDMVRYMFVFNNKERNTILLCGRGRRSGWGKREEEGRRGRGGKERGGGGGGGGGGRGRRERGRGKGEQGRGNRGEGRGNRGEQRSVQGLGGCTILCVQLYMYVHICSQLVELF